MNVIFHTTTAIGITALLTDTKRLEQTNSEKTIFLTSIFAFMVGVIFHGALDYMPHCYPINSKLDVDNGMLKSVKVGKEKLYLNPKLLKILENQ